MIILGSYIDLSLAKARELTRELSARVSLGYDVAMEKQERKAEALAKIDAEKNAIKVSDLAAEYFERQILPLWKHPDILRRRIDKDINPRIGNMKLEDVKPRHIDDMLKGIVDRGAPTIATDVLRWVRRIFDYGIRRQLIDVNPCSAFEVADAGGKEVSRDRWLTREELINVLRAFRTSTISRQNEISFKILLALCLRKMELCIKTQGFESALYSPMKYREKSEWENFCEGSLSVLLGFNPPIREGGVSRFTPKFTHSIDFLNGKIADSYFYEHTDSPGLRQGASILF